MQASGAIADNCGACPGGLVCAEPAFATALLLRCYCFTTAADKCGTCAGGLVCSTRTQGPARLLLYMCLVLILYIRWRMLAYSDVC